LSILLLRFAKEDGNNIDGGGEKGEKGNQDDVVDTAAECGVEVVVVRYPIAGGVGVVGPPRTLLLVGVVVENDDAAVDASGVRKLCNNGFSTTELLLLLLLVSVLSLVVLLLLWLLVAE
jgi:hypothetical protein